MILPDNLDDRQICERIVEQIAREIVLDANMQNDPNFQPWGGRFSKPRPDCHAAGKIGNC